MLQGNGDGTFQALAPVPLTTHIRGLVAGDFNGDGNLDLATSNDVYYYTGQPANNVSVLLGNGDGTFQTPTTFPTGSNPAAIVTGDFNGDGRLDLVTANFDTSDMTALLGTGTGTFLPAELAPSPVQSTPLVADLTGSEVIDAVVLTARADKSCSAADWPTRGRSLRRRS